MQSETVSNNFVGMVFDKARLSDKQLCEAMRDALRRFGIRQWRSIDADVFTYCGRTLVLARPTPPLLHRVPHNTPRIRRG